MSGSQKADTHNVVAETPTQDFAVSGEIVARGRCAGEVERLDLADAVGLSGGSQVEVSATAAGDDEDPGYCTWVEDGAGGVVAVFHAGDEGCPLGADRTSGGIVAVAVDGIRVGDEDSLFVCREGEAVCKLMQVSFIADERREVQSQDRSLKSFWSECRKVSAQT